MTSGSVLALTGATGFIGNALLNRLTTTGYRVRALYRPRAGRSQPGLPGVEWISGDLQDAGALEALVTGTQAVIHCAGSVRGITQADFDSVNVDGAMRVAQAAARQIQAPRFLLISSLAARSPQLSHYAGSKWRGECALKKVAADLPWTIFRPPAVYGPGDREMLPLFRGIEKGFALLPAGAGRRLSLIYVDDLASAVARWLETTAADGQTLELDDGCIGGYDWDSILETAGSVLRNNKRVNRLAIPMTMLKTFAHINLTAARIFGYAPMLTPGKVMEITHPDWVCNNYAFAQLTGWKPMFDFEQGLSCTFGKNIAVPLET